jgi:hypothetical protein
MQEAAQHVTFLSRNLLCCIRAYSTDVSAIELTALQFPEPMVTHGHGAENAGETSLNVDSHVYKWSQP